MVGTAFIPAVVLHLLFARAWIIRTVRIFFSTTRWRTRINFLLNAALFVLMVIEIVSGLEISQVALPWFGFAGIDDRAWRALHNDTARWVELIVCMHVAMNWSWIEGVFIRSVDAGRLNAKKTFIAPSGTAATVWVIIVVVASLLVAVITYRYVGPPTLVRLYSRNEIANYRSTLRQGLFEIIGEALFIVLFTIVGRVVFRMRL